jgi:hypothetical protein
MPCCVTAVKPTSPRIHLASAPCFVCGTERAEKAVYRPELERADRQPCFDRLFNDRRGASLSPEELDAFVETVKESCLDD